MHEPSGNILLALVEGARAVVQLLLEPAKLLLARVDAGQLLVETFVEVFPDRHQLFFGGQHEALALLRGLLLDAAAPHIEDQCRDEHAAEDGRDDRRDFGHDLSPASPPDPLSRGERGTMGGRNCQPATAFRFAGGSILARSSASAASRAATSRSLCFAWNSSFVISSAAKIAALCVSTNGP